MLEYRSVLWRERNVALYYGHSLVHAFWFIEGVWYFFWSGYASFEQLGLIFSGLSLVWIVSEVPSGVLADKYGRKTAIVTGNLLMLLGGSVFVWSSQLWVLVAGAMVGSVGRAFVSGSFEALIYDGLLEKSLEGFYDKIIAFKMQLQIAAYVVGPVIGGYLFVVNERIPYLLQSVAMGAALWWCLQLVETKVRKFKDIQVNPNIEGFVQLYRSGFRQYLIPTVLGLTVFYLYDWGLSKPTIGVNGGLDSRGLSVTISVIALLCVLVVGLVPKMRRGWSDKRLLLAANSVMALGFVIGGLPIGWGAIVGMVMIDLGAVVHGPVYGVLVNRHVASAYRATSLSTLEFLARAPFMVLNVLVGFAIGYGWAGKFHVLLGVLVLGVSVVYGWRWFVARGRKGGVK